jgi:nitroreductase
MRILIAGTKAPSASNQQGWEFIIVDNPTLIEKIADRKYILNRGNKPRRVKVDPDTEARAKLQKESFAQASLVVVYNKRGLKADAWLCIENMCLAAVAEGEKKAQEKECISFAVGWFKDHFIPSCIQT